MEFPAHIILSWLSNLLWPFIRVSTILMSMSFFGAQFITPKIRLYLGLAITFILMPNLPQMPDVALFSLAGYIIIAQQIVIGLCIGMTIKFFIQTFVLLGQILGMQSSLGFASMVDPANGQSTPVLGQFYLFLATILFIAENGHLAVLELVGVSFHSIPIGQWPQIGIYHELASWFGIMFRIAFNMAIAGVVALLTVNLSFGIMTRAAPQLNIFSLGFSFILLLGFLISGYIVSDILSHFNFLWQMAVEQIGRVINLYNGG